MSKKRLGIGFIGGGFITRFHIQSLISVRNVDVIGVNLSQLLIRDYKHWHDPSVWEITPKHTTPLLI